MQFNLDNKVALITGSSRGIGLNIAKALYAENCKVVLNSRNSKELELITGQLPGSFGVAGDVTNPIEAKRIISEVIEHFSKIDILICNVGSGQSVFPGEETLEEWQRIFSINLWSATNMIEAAKDLLAETKGNIVCISSICGMEIVNDAPVTYSAAKAALNNYVKGISRPLAKKNIRINAIAPGNILFDGSTWSRKLQKDMQSVQVMIEKNVPMNCFGKPQDISNLVIYLASDLACFATGGIWPLDGGQTHA